MSFEQSKRQRYRRLFRTILISGGALLVTTMISFFLVPVISNTVGTEAYGFVSLARTFEQYAVIATMALNAFAARHIAVSYHEGDLEASRRYFASTFYGDAILATGIFAAALVLTGYLDRVFSISADLVPDVKLLFLFMFAEFWIITMSTAFSATAHVKNRLDITNSFKLAGYLLEACILFLCYRFLCARVSYVGLGRVACALVTAAGGIWVWRRYTRELAVRRRYFSRDAVRHLLTNGAWTSFNSVGGVLNDGLDLWVCNLMLTPLGMGQLAIAKTFQSFFTGAFTVIGQTFEPLFLKSYAQNDRKTLLDELKLSMKLSGMLSNIFFAGFVALGVPFYALWIPKEDILLLYGLTIVSNLATVPSGPMFPLYYIYVLTAKNRFPTVMTVAGGVLNVLAMFLLLSTTDLGNYAILWTSVAVSAMIAFVSNPLYMAHVLDLPWWTFYPNILRNLLSCGVMTGVFWLLSRLYQPASWPGLIASACVLFLLGAALHTGVVFSRRDRKKLLRLLRRKKTGREDAP